MIVGGLFRCGGFDITFFIDHGTRDICSVRVQSTEYLTYSKVHRTLEQCGCVQDWAGQDSGTGQDRTGLESLPSLVELDIQIRRGRLKQGVISVSRPLDLVL